MIAVFLIALLVVVAPLIKMVIKSLNTHATKGVDNIGKGFSNSTDALPTMGASFAATTISEAMAEVPALKQALNCTDDKVVTMIQLHKWMSDHGMM